MSQAMLFRVATMPGDPQRPNEDFAGILGDCAILLDGSGAPGDMPTGCVHGVPWFVRQLGSRCLAGMAAGEHDQPLEGILARAISEVAALHRDTCDLGAPGTPSSVVIMIRTSAESLDYLVLGDSALVIEDTTDSIKVLTDKRMEAVAANEYQAMLALPTGTPEHQAARIAFVRRQQPMRNAPGGYPVASTDVRAAAEAVTGSIPADTIRRAAMLSDGVTRFTEFGIGTWAELLNILADGGPDDLLARIREAEGSDPQGKRWPRAKRHDDVGVVFWEGSHLLEHTQKDAVRLIETYQSKESFALKAPAEPEPSPEYSQLVAEVAALRAGVQALSQRLGSLDPAELTEALGRIEGNLVELYDKTANEYPWQELPGGVRRSRAMGKKGGSREQRA